MSSLSARSVGNDGCPEGYVVMIASGHTGEGALTDVDLTLDVCVPNSAWIVQQLRPNGYEQIQTRIVSDPLLQWVMAVQVITLVLVVAVIRLKNA